MNIFITGADKGLGYSLVKALEKEHEVIPYSKSTHGEISSVDGGAHIKEFIDSTDVLINNAFYHQYKTIGECGYEDFDKIIVSNLNAQFLILKSFYQGFKNRGFGKIINISSLVCEHPNNIEPLYGAAKMAQLGLARSLQMDCFNSKIRIVNLLVGAMYNHGGNISPDEVSLFIKMLIESPMESCYPSEIILRK